jgi:hypothetical protein
MTPGLYAARKSCRPAAQQQRQQQRTVSLHNEAVRSEMQVCRPTHIIRLAHLDSAWQRNKRTPTPQRLATPSEKTSSTHASTATCTTGKRPRTVLHLLFMPVRLTWVCSICACTSWRGNTVLRSVARGQPRRWTSWAVPCGMGGRTASLRAAGVSKARGQHDVCAACGGRRVSVVAWGAGGRAWQHN